MKTTENLVLGNASTETQGHPFGFDEPMGLDEGLGVASMETQGLPDGTDEVIGKDFDLGLSDC